MAAGGCEPVALGWPGRGTLFASDGGGFLDWGSECPRAGRGEVWRLVAASRLRWGGPAGGTLFASDRGALPDRGSECPRAWRGEVWRPSANRPNPGRVS